jgi:hypothetical protein
MTAIAIGNLIAIDALVAGLVARHPNLGRHYGCSASFEPADEFFTGFAVAVRISARRIRH